MGLYKSLPELRQQALIRADRLGAYGIGKRFTPSELNESINASIAELHDLLLTAWADYFDLASYQTSVAVPSMGDIAKVALPFDQRLLRGVDVLLGGPWITIDRAPFEQRNRLSFLPVSWNFYGVPNVKYCEQGGWLFFFPPSVAAQTVRIWYVPPPQILVDTLPLPPWPQNATVSYGDMIDVVIAGVNYAFRAVQGGVTGAYVTPPFPTSPGTVLDGTAIWSFAGLASQVSTYLDSVARWDEYVILDAAIKMMAKDDRDASALAAAKEAVRLRIVSAGALRDAAQPARVNDIYAENIYPMESGDYD